jgi:hypothetical protein
LYDKGENSEVKSLVWTKVTEERASTDPELGKLMVTRAWAHWRDQEWEDARDWLNRAQAAGGAEDEVLRLEATFAVRDGNDVKLLQLASQVPKNPGLQNALILRARGVPGMLTLPEVVYMADQLEDVHPEPLQVANVCHNAGRFCLDNGSRMEDFAIAAGLLGRAIRLYGTDIHWHHRAAASFWLAKSFQRWGGQQAAAIQAVRDSISLWDEAISNNPTNEGYRTNRVNAEQLLQGFEAE